MGEKVRNWHRQNPSDVPVDLGKGLIVHGLPILESPRRRVPERPPDMAAPDYGWFARFKEGVYRHLSALPGLQILAGEVKWDIFCRLADQPSRLAGTIGDHIQRVWVFCRLA